MNEQQKEEPAFGSPQAQAKEKPATEEEKPKPWPGYFRHSSLGHLDEKGIEAIAKMGHRWAGKRVSIAAT